MTLNKVIDDKSLIDRIKTLESIQDIIKLKSVYWYQLLVRTKI